MTHILFKHVTNSRPTAGRSPQPRAQFIIRSLALGVAMVGTIGLARAADELPSQDQALAQALENHPEIIAAKAKVSLVEAELYGKRMEVSRQVLGLYSSLKTLDAQIEAAKAALNQSKSPQNTGGGPIDPLKWAAAIEAAEGKLVQATGQREQAERELRLLIGATPGAKETKSSNAAAIPARQIPQGSIVDLWKAAVERSFKISAADMPLTELVNYLSDNTGIKFSVQRPALEVAGLGVDMPISLSIKGVPLAAALQGFEDAYPQLQFVLRDYGVLLTTKEYAQDHGYMPALEIGKEARSGKPR
jgi:hypothetical protein